MAETATLTTPTTPTDQRAVLSAHMALWVAQVAFGLFPLFGKWAYLGFDPGAIAEIRVVFGSAAFLAIAWMLHPRQVLPRRGDLLRMQCCSLLGVGLNQALYLEGLARTTSIVTGLMMMLIPLFTFGIAVLVRAERFSWRRGLGILIALVGASQLILQDGLDLRSDYLLGSLLLVGNTLCYAGYLVWSKPLMQRYPPIVVLAWMYAMSLWMLPFVSTETGWAPEGAPTKAWVAIAVILLFPTFLAYLLNLFALRHVPSSTTAVYIFSQPLIAGAAGWFVLGESLGPGTVVAAVCIFVGIWFVVWRGNSPRGAS